MALHHQEKRVTSKLWTTFLSMLVRSGHSHLLKSLKRQIFRNEWSIYKSRHGDISPAWSTTKMYWSGPDARSPMT